MTVESSEIAYCMFFMYVGAHFERIGGGFFFEKLGIHAAFLTE